MKHSISRILAVIVSSLALAGWLIAAPLSADVGETESFGHAALYMGAVSGEFALMPVCGPMPDPAPPMTANNNQCVQLNPTPDNTPFTAEDICRIKLPKKATRTLIYPALNFFVTYELENSTGVFQEHGVFRFIASVSVESDALLDPSIIDPATGLPANGKLQGLFTYVYQDDRSMRPQDRQRQKMTLVRVGNAGINKATLVKSGLSQNVVDNLFNSSMTLRMSLTGDSRLANEARVTCNMRLFGD